MGYSTQMVRYCLCNPQISSDMEMERKFLANLPNHANLTRKGSNMVKKIAEQHSELYDLDFWVTTQIKKLL